MRKKDQSRFDERRGLVRSPDTQRGHVTATAPATRIAVQYDTTSLRARNCTREIERERETSKAYTLYYTHCVARLVSAAVSTHLSTFLPYPKASGGAAFTESETVT